MTAPSLADRSERDFALDGITEIRGITTPADSCPPRVGIGLLQGEAPTHLALPFGSAPSNVFPFHAAEVDRV